MCGCSTWQCGLRVLIGSHTFLPIFPLFLPPSFPLSLSLPPCLLPFLLPSLPRPLPPSLPPSLPRPLLPSLPLSLRPSLSLSQFWQPHALPIIFIVNCWLQYVPPFPYTDIHTIPSLRKAVQLPQRGEGRVPSAQAAASSCYSHHRNNPIIQECRI